MEQLKLMGTSHLCTPAKPATHVPGAKGPGVWGFGIETGKVPAGTQGTCNRISKDELSPTEASV